MATEETGDRGRPQKYSDDAIICALVIRSVYSLPLRALEGFLKPLIFYEKRHLKQCFKCLNSGCWIRTSDKWINSPLLYR